MKAKKQQQQQQGSKGSDRKSPKATVKGGRGDDKKDKGEGSSKLSEKPDSSHGGIVSDSRARDTSSIEGQSTCESCVGRGATPKKDECLCEGQCMILRYQWLKGRWVKEVLNFKND